MFTHIMVGANDTAQAKQFFDAVVGALGGNPGNEFRPGVVFYAHNGGMFGVGRPADGNDASFANGGTIGLAAASKDQVDGAHAAALANGGSDEGEPGKRPGAPGNAYGAYFRDPTGNKFSCFCQLPEGE
jgi:catechol 2,3-dioxygenase-like lactoylglutathione lyase family enzyme